MLVLGMILPITPLPPCEGMYMQLTVLKIIMRLKVLIPNRDSPNGYSTVMPAELQSVTLSH